MRRIFLSLSMAACLFADCSAAAVQLKGTLIYENVPEAPADAAERLDAYLSARGAAPRGWSPKGVLLIETRFGDVEQLHAVDHPFGERRQLTFQREPITQGAFSPDPARNAFFYLKEAGGNGRTQLYYQRVGEAAARLLSDGKSVNGGALWSNNGREIAFFTTARDGVAHDIDIVNPDGGTLPHLAVTGDSAAWYPLDWSSDDRKLLVLRSVSAAEEYLYVVDLETGQRREIDAAQLKASIRGAKFSRDGQGVYLISDRDSDMAKLRYVNLFTGAKSEISAHIAWDIEQLALSRDGHYLAFVSNEGGVGRLNVVDLRAHQDLITPHLPGPGLIDSLSFDAESKRLAFGFSPENQPQDAFVLDLQSNKLEAWTASEAGPLDVTKFVTPRLVEVPTFDRPRHIPVYLYEPATPGPHPVLVVLHDDPQGQFRPSFDPWIQYVVNELGFAVLAPNVRGSSGYGKAYMALDNGTLREDAVKDVGALLVWLDLQSNFDAKHVVVSGASYGGYLALTALVNYGERLRGAVDFAGITDFVSYLSSASPGSQPELRAEYGDERDSDARAYLRRISPLTNADRITRPLLVVHGKNDALIPSSESDEIVNRLRSRPGAVWYLQATNEGHEFRKQQNRAAYYETFAQFLMSAR